MKQLARMIAALCLFVTLLVLRELPAEIPAHYDSAGNITRWGSKYEFLILPVILLLVSFGSRFLLLHLRRKAEQAGSDKERQAAAANAKVVVIVIFSQTLILSCGRKTLDRTLRVPAPGARQHSAEVQTKRHGRLPSALDQVQRHHLAEEQPLCGDDAGPAGALGIVSTVFAPKGYGMFLLSIYIMAAIVISTVRAWQVYREEKAKEQS